MAVISRIRVSWDGLTGLPGVSTFYATEDPGSAVADIKTFFTSLAGLTPLGLSWTVPGAGDTINDANGQLMGTWSATGGGTVAGGSTINPYAAGVGARVRWLTGAIVGRRRLQGSTFLAPLITNCYEANGTLTSGTLTTITNAANALLAAEPLRVWHRPHPGGSDGISFAIEAALVPDRVTSIRSRRT